MHATPALRANHELVLSSFIHARRLGILVSASDDESADYAGAAARTSVYYPSCTPYWLQQDQQLKASMESILLSQLIAFKTGKSVDVTTACALKQVCEGLLSPS